MIELQSKVFAAFVAASLIVMFPSVITAFHVATVVSVRAHKNPSLDNLRFPHSLYFYFFGQVQVDTLLENF